PDIGAAFEGFDSGEVVVPSVSDLPITWDTSLPIDPRIDLFAAPITLIATYRGRDQHYDRAALVDAPRVQVHLLDTTVPLTASMRSRWETHFEGIATVS